jgi:hypothetical protein
MGGKEVCLGECPPAALSFANNQIILTGKSEREKARGATISLYSAVQFIKATQPIQHCEVSG